jgi:hypothetical protein
MRLRPAALEKLAQFICGDPPLPFPYRSSSKLTAFFADLGLDFIHRGETRNPWTREALLAINETDSSDDAFPSANMVAVIEAVMNPTYFQGIEPANERYEQALSQMNGVLKHYKLELTLEPGTGLPRLKSVDGHFISTAHSSPNSVKKITFAPKVFEVPHSVEVQHDLVAIMMPFDAAFAPVHDAINDACVKASLRSKRADDIWANSTIIQDIVDLICAAEIVVVDFSGKNSNVMYETGIAHTLGKHVVPITQSLEHVPFDLQSHRVLPYHPNIEGLSRLTEELKSRLLTIKTGHAWDR